jgi:hypothetical protein
MSQRLKKLNQKQWELALQVVHKTWQSNQPTATLHPPPELSHLKPKDWEEICRALWVLECQKEASQLH